MKNKNIGLVLIIIFTLNASILVVSTPASWVVNGISICTARGDQWYPEICSDGAGGAIITWRDSRNGYWDIYAQRIDSTGSVRWALNGIPICDAVDHQIDPMICSDGNGGAFFVWGDKRNGANWQIYAQRVDANGNKKWSENGIVICNKSCVVNHQIIYSGNGNIIIAWKDYRPEDAIYAQKLDLNGNIQWKTNGAPICNATSTQWTPRICTDGEGGAIIVWDDERRFDYWNEDLYAQRINSDGVVQWEFNGVNISNSGGSTSPGQLVSDKNGGAIITWLDDRSGNYNVYAQRVSHDGALLWNQGGIIICDADNSKGYTRIVEDGWGGAIVTWEDCRTGSNWDIYAQRIDPNGIMKWEENGVLMYNADNDGDLYSTLRHQSCYDGKSGIYVVYLDYRNNLSSRDVYAQYIDLNGYIQWENNGKPICNDPNDQGYPKAVVTKYGGAITVWPDYRNGFDADIYAFLTSLSQIIGGYNVILLLLISLPIIVLIIKKTRKFMNPKIYDKENEK